MPKLEIVNSAEPSNPVSRLSSDWFSGDLIETLPAAVYVCNAASTALFLMRAGWEEVSPPAFQSRTTHQT